MFIPDSDFDFLPIPDPRSKGQKGNGSRIRNTDHKLLYLLNHAYCGSSTFAQNNF